MNVSDNIKKLLEHLNSIDVHSVDALGETPLMKACSQNADSAVDLLIKKGANVNYYNEKSIGGPATALMLAAATNAEETVKILIENNAEIETCHKINGMTALMFAAKNNAEKALQVLLQSGANLEAKTFGLIGVGKTALILAVTENHKEIVGLLLQKGAKTKPLGAIDRKKISAAMVKWLKAKGAL
ncbi:ankyrin repeat domain-containing protein [Aquimarina mytili]|uniref:Ankyrin repeat domain-containing protein n=1 Tax=Aquimarina mytili TaxID=874423 RepID=A0A936ZRA9_9FLAO|nr:ankyrin repeat domain-containing protein [Aquimarina mytili]MBL0683957.1 ankyrin repeat domain-containing protein [Aquimarina mytili]